MAFRWWCTKSHANRPLFHIIPHHHLLDGGAESESYWAFIGNSEDDEGNLFARNTYLFGQVVRNMSDITLHLNSPKSNIFAWWLPAGWMWKNSSKGVIVIPPLQQTWNERASSTLHVLIFPSAGAFAWLLCMWTEWLTGWLVVSYSVCRGDIEVWHGCWGVDELLPMSR